ncbi:MAG TPA: c-type cytochrome [Bryobacteraceae bacterium]|jgi:mono/diheme cytochrome c family protein|nr:c-type cytochrome [Bryobacteraceae bacterium]
MKKGLGVAAVCAVLLIGGGAWFASRGFSAREKPGPIESFLAGRARDLATPAAARKLQNPVVATELAVAEGRDHFADHCAVCHANNGSGNTEMGRNMYPPAPDMRSGRTQELTDGEIFHIIREGVRFTGMPGWGGDDEDNWKLVVFIRRLPKLSEKELELMKEINGQGPEQSHTP